MSNRAELIQKLSEHLYETFEDNICAVFGEYASDELLPQNEYDRIQAYYDRIRDTYLEALADVIEFQDSY